MRLAFFRKLRRTLTRAPDLETAELPRPVGSCYACRLPFEGPSVELELSDGSRRRFCAPLCPPAVERLDVDAAAKVRLVPTLRELGLLVFIFLAFILASSVAPAQVTRPPIARVTRTPPPPRVVPFRTPPPAGAFRFALRRREG